MGIHKLIPGALNEHKDKVQKPHFLFSAENPRHPHKNELNHSHEEALHHLKSRGFDAHEVNGHYGAPEKSIIVYGVGPKTAEHLHGYASKLGQDSSIYSTGQNHEMRFHHGLDQGKRVRGQGTVWHNEKPSDFFTTLPGGTHHFTHNFDFDNPEMGKSEKVGDLKAYRKNAKEGCDVMFRVKIRGKHKLEEGIPLHMSIKIFKSVEEADLDKLKKQIKELNLTERPDPKKLKFRAEIFTGRDGNKYYMLKIDGLSEKFQKFYEMNKDRGTVYDNNFMPHVTINKELYDDIKDKGLAADDIEFEPLIMEAGAGNTYHEFAKSEVIAKSDYGPKKMDLYNHADNARRKETRTGEIAAVGPNKAVRQAGPTKAEQAEAQARADKAKSKSSPVKHFNANQIKYLNQKAKAHGGNLGVPIKGKLAASEEFDNSLAKGPIKNTIAALGAVGAMAAPQRATPSSHPIMPTVQRQAPANQNQYSSKRMLATIADVESKGGKNTGHKAVAGGMHHGESAIGKYALMPAIVRDTVHMNPDLKQKHKKLMSLQGDDVRHYMEDNPGLEDEIAQRHLQRLEHHFGQDPSTIGYAWLEGVTGTYKAKKEKKDIANHWHVKKINDAYSRIK